MGRSTGMLSVLLLLLSACDAGGDVPHHRARARALDAGQGDDDSGAGSGDDDSGAQLDQDDEIDSFETWCEKDAGLCAVPDTCTDDDGCLDDRYCTKGRCTPYDETHAVNPGCLAMDLTARVDYFPFDSWCYVYTDDGTWEAHVEVCNRGQFMSAAPVRGTFFRGRPSAGSPLCTASIPQAPSPGQCVRVACRAPDVERGVAVWFEVEGEGNVGSECLEHNNAAFLGAAPECVPVP